MAVGRMLKIQLLGHNSIREELKRFLREAGAIEVTDVSIEHERNQSGEATVRELDELLEKAGSAAAFLSGYAGKRSFFDRVASGPMRTTFEEGERLLREFPVDDIWQCCSDLQNTIRNSMDELARSRELVHSLEPWRQVITPLESLTTRQYEVQFWTLPAVELPENLVEIEDRFPLVHFEECSAEGGRSYTMVIVGKSEADRVSETFKEYAGFRSSFDGLEGTPAEVIEAETKHWDDLERAIRDAEQKARETAAERDKLLLLSDHIREKIGLTGIERQFCFTDSAFVLEGWIIAPARPGLERALSSRFREIEVSFRQPRDDEEPPIALQNRSLSTPYEFVTTLYGRPVYREIDPTPLLAPFFVLFFAMCLTDAGYGLTLSALSALILTRFKPSGGAGKLMRVMFMGGIATAVIGVISGGIFGIDAASLPPFIKRFVLIDPLEEPMKMLNIAFLMGVVHMLFGMGIRMFANIRAGLVADALFDDLFWMLFLIFLAPLGFSAILGGYVPPAVHLWSKRAVLVIAAAIFLTAGRKQKGIVKKFFKGLIGFYDVVGYFGDVLSYARLLALGLATSAIAIAVNGIAGMVKGLPFYTGYIVAVLILVLGHAFNFAVNALGAFVHSGRLQYLEFFSKFFTGGGREFKPFRSERQYSVVREAEEKK